jgi:hypothetical protein
VIEDPTGARWLRLDEVCNGRCGKMGHGYTGGNRHVGTDITCGMVKGWVKAGRVRRQHVGRAVWYLLDGPEGLAEAERAVRQDERRGWKRGRRRPPRPAQT